MRLLMIAAAALSLAVIPATSFAAATPPYKLNSAGKCIGANGQFAKQTLCAAPAAPAPAVRCRDKTTKKFVKCGTANSEPVPAATHR